LAIAQHHLLAVDESAGHIQIFDLDRPDAFNTDLAGYAAPRPNRPTGYQGFIGHAPLVDFEDKTNLELQKQVKTGSIIPGQSNPPGYFCSPDSIASYTDQASGETYIAIADQCNYRIVVYRWSDIAKAIGVAVTMPRPTPVANNAGSERKTALPDVKENTGAAGSRNTAPGAAKVKVASAGKVAGASLDKVTGAGGGAGRGAVAVTSKSNVMANSVNDAATSGKKEKKAKKEKKTKTKL